MTLARFDMSGLNSVIDEMRRLEEDTGPTDERMIMAGAEEVKKAWRRSAEEHNHRDTGDMIESIGYPRKPENIGGALSIDIYPQGTDHKGVRNAEKAFILHYGTSKRPGSRWVDDADRYSEDTAVPEMKRIWDEYVQSKTKG